MRFNVGFITDIGRKRSQNQDSLAVVPEAGLFLVADGMGGHRGGEIASAIASEIIPEYVSRFLKQTTGSNWNPRTVLSEAIQKANQEIFRRSQDQPPLSGMGTTATALLFRDGRLVIGHVGDSRCYFFRPEGSWQATRDHSLVQEKFHAGLISRDEIKTDRMKNVITRSVGFEPTVQVELYEMNVVPGDTFLLCSDGLSGMINDEETFKIVHQGLFKESNITQTVQTLIDNANSNGGEDNVTAVLVQVME